MSKAFDYRTGAVQAMPGFELFALKCCGYTNRKYILDCVSNGNLHMDFRDLSMFSPKIVKKALKRLKIDYPHQMLRFGKFSQDDKVYLAIQPERPSPPDQWMIVGQVVTV